MQSGNSLVVIDPRPYEATSEKDRAGKSESLGAIERAMARIFQSQAEQTATALRANLAKKRLDRAELLDKEKSIAEEDYDMRHAEHSEAI